MSLSLSAPLVAAALVCTPWSPRSPSSPDVVELKDGTRHAGEIRSRRNGVELATPIGVHRFALAEVTAIEPRAEQLPLYRAARATAARQPHALVSLARWCLDRGLYGEAFDSLDRALEAAPQEPLVTGALAAIVDEALLDGAIPNEWPDVEKRERLLERVGGKSRSRAAFARNLLLKAPTEELVPWLIDELSDLDHAVRIGAIDLLGEVRSDAGLAKLIRLSLIDGSAQIRDHALAAAVKSEHPGLATPYLRALQTDDARIRERACPALAMLRDPRAVPALIHALEPRPVAAGGSSAGTLPRAHVFFGEQRAYVQDFDVEVAQGAVIAKPIIGVLQSGVILDAAVAGVQVISYVERVAVVSALERLSGQRLGNRPETWATWWDGQGGKLPELPVAAANPGTDASATGR